MMTQTHTPCLTTRLPSATKPITTQARLNSVSAQPRPTSSDHHHGHASAIHDVTVRSVSLREVVFFASLGIELMLVIFSVIM